MKRKDRSGSADESNDFSKRQKSSRDSRSRSSTPMLIEGSPADVVTEPSVAIKRCIDDLDDWAGDAIEKLNFSGRQKTVTTNKKTNIRLDLQGQTNKNFANLQLQIGKGKGKGKGSLACVLVEIGSAFGREQVVDALKKAYETKNIICLLTL